MPIIRAAHGGTLLQAAVIETRPESIAFVTENTSMMLYILHFLLSKALKNTTDKEAAAADMIVFITIFPG